MTLVGTIHQGAPGYQACPGGLCPPRVLFGPRLSFVLLVLQDKKIFIYLRNLLTSVSWRNLPFSFLVVFCQIQSIMAASSSSKDKFFNNVINPYLREVMQHPQAIQMQGGVLHIYDVQGPKVTGSVEARLEAMEQDIFRCKGMVEHGLNANHLMIANYTRDLKVDGKSIKDIVFSLNEQMDFLHSQI